MGTGWRAATGLAALAAAMAAAGLLIAADAPTGGEPGVRAFVLSNIYIASSGDAGACPAMAEGDLDLYYRMLPPAQRARYELPGKPGELAQAKRPELERAMNEALGFRRISVRSGRGDLAVAKLPEGFALGTIPTPQQALEIGRLNGFPEGRGRIAFGKTEVVYSACSNPEDFPQLGKAHRTYDGPVAPGMDLDGKVGREDFTGLDGSKGVDNQLWRAVGCVRPFRENSDPPFARKTMLSARAPTLIELRGVDDAANDPEVTVSVYAGADPLTRDGRGQALAGATFTLDPDPALRATTRGRIVGGVLLTDPFDFRVNYKEQIIDAPRQFRGARIRATLLPDGTIEGGIYGYYDLASYYSSIEQMTQNGANLTGVSCPGVRRAVERLADGYPDRRTGRNTAISTAHDFLGVRAFIVKP